MYVDHPGLDKPLENAKIWRYMDLWKLQDMLGTSSLHFTRVDKLDDGLEGSWGPSGAIQAYESYGREYVEKLKYWECVFRTIGAVNCWHVNTSESQHMWDLYVRSEDGVVVQSTFSALREAVDASPHKVHLGLMRYIDYGRSKFTDCTNTSFGNFTTFFNYKDKRFEHESELRALILAMGTQSERAQPLSPDGTKVAVNMQELLKKVHLRPDAESDKLSQLQRLCSDHGIDTEVMPSSLVSAQWGGG